MTLEEIKQKLKDELTAYRYEHSFIVADKSRELAEIHGESKERAYLAGLVHDCAKEFGPTKMKEYLPACEKYMYLDDLQNPGIWHSFVCAEVAQNEYHIQDEAVISAIRWHTTGKMKMSDLELIVYCADCASPRDYGSNEERAKRFEVCKKDLYVGALSFLRFEEEICREFKRTFVSHGREMIDWLESK